MFKLLKHDPGKTKRLFNSLDTKSIDGGNKLIQMIHNAFTVINGEEKVYKMQTNRVQRLDMLSKNQLALQFCKLKEETRLESSMKELLRKERKLKQMDVNLSDQRSEAN